jgi:NAD(P) transhydrogenase subunit alpha
MIEAMKPGAVIVDLAAESGGNCELTSPGTTVIRNGVLIDGPLNLASEAATHASEMYAHNLLNLLELLVEGETVTIDREDEVVEGALLTYEGELVHKATAELLSLNTAIDSRGSC